MPRHIIEFTEYIAKAYMERWFDVKYVIRLEAVSEDRTRVYLADHCHRGTFILAAHSIGELQSRIDAGDTYEAKWERDRASILKSGYDIGELKA